MQPPGNNEAVPAETITAEQEIQIGSVGDLANISHQKADIGLITFSKDKVLAMLAVSGSLSSNFLSGALTSALAIFLALISGVAVKDGWQGTLWLGFFNALAFSIYFGILTFRQERQRHKFREQIEKAPSTPLR